MKILIAEDDSASRLTLKAILQKWGHEVVVAEDGNQAWEAIQTDNPKMAILDWMMPGIEGIELCRRVRDMADRDYIYVILLTAKVEKEDIIGGLDAGADDYIAKPFDMEVLRSRVAVGARMIQYEALLAEKNEQLQRYGSDMEKLAEERSKQLIHAERMATVGLLSAGVAHEINNPTTFIAGNIQTLEKFSKDIEPILLEQIKQGPENKGKLEFILQELPRTIEGIRNGVKRISRIVKGLKSFCRKNENIVAACDINSCVEQALELCHNTLKYYVSVEQDLSDNLPNVKADSQQIEQVLINLFINAADAMREQGQGTLAIKTESSDNSVIIKVSDTGPGIPEDKFDDIWQPFFTTKPTDKGTGLGLFTVRGIIENHEGQIEFKNKSSGGAEFTITLPTTT
ncbi:MAG: response regulator [Sedimentisphaerales bacterium]|nr:response regulator [Sedimentisphaerales bacterium]